MNEVSINPRIKMQFALQSIKFYKFQIVFRKLLEVYEDSRKAASTEVRPVHWNCESMMNLGHANVPNAREKLVPQLF